MDINRDAPVVASAEALIEAPVDLVWSLLIDIDGWPRWNPAVERAALDGPPQAGTAFRWKAGGASIASRLEAVRRPAHLVWTGRTRGIRAVHAWHLRAEEGGTRVRTEESFDGVWLRLLAGPMRRMLASSLEQGLGALKGAAERRAAAGRA
ncbi:MAG: SRPBCC family protein [Chromatiales bacterium]|jgi:uncharacterized protein YndB with AHSA1/START domain